MKRYQSHKIVEAARIRAVIEYGPFRELVLDGEEKHIRVDPGWLLIKDAIERGDAATGYFVRYADGYCSWSPAEAFEEGYTELKTAPEPAPEQMGQSVDEPRFGYGGD